MPGVTFIHHRLMIMLRSKNEVIVRYSVHFHETSTSEEACNLGHLGLLAIISLGKQTGEFDNFFKI